MTSHLVPEKRLDRNGRLVTRHVASRSSVAGASSIPAPLVPKKENFAPAAEQLVANKIEVTGTKAIVSEGLNRALKRRSRPLSFTASDVEIYSVLSVAGTCDAAALLTHGIRSSSEARLWLKENNLGYLEEDYSGLAEQALQRRIPADAYFKILMDGNLYGVPASVVLDAAEVRTMTGEGNPVWEDVLGGSVRIEDIRKIGAERLGWCAGLRTGQYVRDFLKELKVEDVDLEEQHLNELLEERKVTYGFDKAPALVKKFGYERTVKFHSFGAAHSMWRYVESGDDNDDIPRVAFFDDMVRVCDELRASGVQDGKLGWNGFQWAKVNHWYEAGLTPEEAVACHRGITTVERILTVREAVDELGVVPSVSSGWL